jgi:CrcB protein
MVRLGEFLGAVTRFLVDGWVSRATGGAFLWGTLLINLSGSFLLGLLFAMATERSLLSPDLRPPLMIGFLGAYTTFSTLMLENWRMVEDGALLAAFANLGGSVGSGAITRRPPRWGSGHTSTEEALSSDEMRNGHSALRKQRSWASLVAGCG